MTKSEAYAIVLQDLQKCSVFTGLYDAKNGSRIFMNGISNVMETIAYGVSEEVGDAFADLFIDNMVKCEKEAQNKRANTPTEASSEAEWIPCKEGLPKAEFGESDCVLATCGWKSDTKPRWIEKLYFNGGNWCYPTGECFTHKVIAWKPLPEPYREDGGE